MAVKRPLLSILNPAYHIVNYQGVPMYRAQAWALEDARLHGQKFTVSSGDRRKSTIAAFNKKYGTNLHDQEYLYNQWVRRVPGFLPANPPTQGTHLLLGDGVVGVRGRALEPYQLGLDITSAGHANDCGPLVAWLNANGYDVYRPYPSSAEAHHMCFRKSPATNARKRLARFWKK